MNEPRLPATFNRRVHPAAGLLLAIGLTLAAEGVANGQAPPKARMLVLQVENGKLTARLVAPPATGQPVSADAAILVYCDAGQVAAGDPRAKPKETRVGPFYMSETEISQKIFFQVLANGCTPAEQEAWQKASPDELRRLTREEYHKMFPSADPNNQAAGKLYADDKYPMYDVSLQEAAFFCRCLESAYERASGGGGLISYHFRLPTSAEWQYAARAKASPAEAEKVRHFTHWPAGTPAEVRDFCQSLYKDLALPGVATVDFANLSQDEVVGILEKALPETEIKKDQMAKALKILKAYLRDGPGVDRDFESGKPSALLPVDDRKSKENGWGLRGMVGGVSEWVLLPRSNDPDQRTAFARLQRWSEKEQAEWEDKHPEDKNACARAGGNFDGTWKEYLIWGGESTTYSDSVDPNKVGGFLAGIRLLVEVKPSSNPGAYVRSQLATNKKVTKDELEKRIKQLDDQLNNLKAESPDAAEALVPLVNRQKALAYQAANDRDNAMKYMKLVESNASPKTKDFVALLGYQLKNDSPAAPPP
jgi:formylglycine-generating enzyme required for sulfatase activity